MKKHNMLFGKVPPQAIDAEQSVIGSCLIEREAFEAVHEVIQSHEVFYRTEHQLIFAAILKVYQDGYPVDLLTVTNELRKTNSLEEAGGAYGLTMLSANVTSTAHVQTHALIVKEKFNARELIRLCSDAISKAFSEEHDVFDLLQDTERSIQSIAEGNSVSSFTPVGETFTEMLMDLEEMKHKPDGLTGIDTGYPEINEMTDGWQASNLVLIAARPSVGKTALALNFALNANCGVLIFSLEANKKELVKRFAAAKSDVFFYDVKKGKLSEFQEKKLHEQIRAFNSLDIKIDDKTQSIGKIIAGIRREKKRNPNTRLVIVDYLQLVRGQKDKNSNREQEVASISRELKLIASELDITVIALSQLNREVEKTANKRPSLANLRESGALEQDANIVMMIWRQEVSETEQKHWILFEKNRDGKCGDVQLRFNGDIQKWTTPDPFAAIQPNPRQGMPNRLPNDFFEEEAPF
jgi:replicative DNA helicase